MSVRYFKRDAENTIYRDKLLKTTFVGHILTATQNTMSQDILRGSLEKIM